MTALPKIRMTVDQYLAWAEDNPGRYELMDGIIYAMSPETVAHAEVKHRIQSALSSAIRTKKLPCRALPDGMTVRVDEWTSFEPDALVYCGERVPPQALIIPSPVIIVEVLSPSARRIDVSHKLAEYFRLPSVQHYLIFETDRPLVIHHSRGEGEAILTRIVRQGTIALDLPGIELSLADIYAG